MKFLLKTLPGLGILILTILFADFVLRFVPSPVQYPPWHEIGDPASLVGIEIIPSTKTQEREPCLTANITTNSLDWRDKERTVKKPDSVTRIAVLGDSYIEGSQVNDDQTFTRQLEQMLPPGKFEVLNFGLSSIGTVQERILYEKLVKNYDPDIVIVAFYMNDVRNNDPVLEGGPGKNTPLAYLDENGQVIRFTSAGPFYGLRKWLRNNSTLFRLAKTAFGQLSGMISRPQVSTTVSSYPVAYLSYVPPTDSDWQRAWNTTEQTVLALKREIEPDRRFFLMLIPDIVEVAPDPAALVRKNYGVDPPPGFDVNYPRLRLTGFAEKNGIKVIDPQPELISYRKTHDLQFPYFSFTCDGHLSPLGLKLLAEKALTDINRQLRPESGRQ